MNLEESETRYRRLFETAQDGILILDASTGKITDVNPFLITMLGYSHAEFLGKKLWEIGAFKDIDASRADFRELQKNDYIRYENLPLQAKDGRRIDVEFVSNIYLVDHERVIQCNIRDITERKRTENELSRNQNVHVVLKSLLALELKDLPLDQILKQSLDLILSSTWLAIESKGGVFLVEGEPAVLVLKAEKGLSEQILKACSRISFGECLCGRAAAEKKIQFSDHIDECHDITYEGIVSHGHYCVPILSSGKALGVIVLYLKEGHRNDLQEENFLLAIAGSFAGTIQRKRTEEEIKSIARFPSENPFPVLRLNQDGTLLYANEASQALLQKLGSNVGDQVPVFWHDLTTEALASQSKKTVEIQFGEKTYAFVITPIISEGYVNLYVSDITERKQAEKTLLKLSSVVEQTADNVFIVDRDGVIEYVNPAFEQLTGYPKEEAIGKTLHLLRSGMHSVQELELLWATILAGKVYQGIMINRKKNGELYYEEKTITPLRDNLGNITHFVSTGKDLTDQRQHVHELEAISAISMTMRTTQTIDEMLPKLLDTSLEMMHATLGSIWLYDPASNELCVAETRGWDEVPPDQILPEKPGEGINGFVYASGQAYVGSDFNLDLRLPERLRQLIPDGLGGAVFPLRAGENVIGTLNINVFSPRELTPNETHLMTTLSEIAGSAIQRMRLYEKTQQDLKRFACDRYGNR